MDRKTKSKDKTRRLATEIWKSLIKTSLYLSFEKLNANILNYPVFSLYKKFYSCIENDLLHKIHLDDWASRTQPQIFHWGETSNLLKYIQGRFCLHTKSPERTVFTFFQILTNEQVNYNGSVFCHLLLWQASNRSCVIRLFQEHGK